MSTRLETGALPFPDGFGDEARALRGRYGPAGVWGRDGRPTLGPGVEYLGAWRESLAVGPRGDRFLTGDTAALGYRLDGGEYRVWLWAAARPRQREGRLGRANVTRVAVGAEAGEGWSLAAFAPRRATRTGPVSVSLDGRGPSVRTPLPGGGLGPVSGATRTGPDGRVTVAWDGIASDARSVNAVCAFEPTGETRTPFRVGVSASLSGGRGVL